jgi:hypothetical protein
MLLLNKTEELNSGGPGFFYHGQQTYGRYSVL